MARLFVTSINLNKNELQNARIQNLSTAPSSPVSGQIYFDTVTKVLYFYDGLQWVPTSGSTEVIQDLIGSSLSGGVGLTSTYDDGSGTTTIDLDNTTVTAGSYGSTTQIPTFTVDAQGRLTAAGTVDVATTLSIAAESGTADTVNLLTDTLTFSAGEGIDTTVSNNTITIAGEDATTTNKGIASFESADFDVSTGHVSLEDTVVKGIVTDSGALTPSGHGLSILGGEGVDVTHVGTTITVTGEDATSVNKGIASFDSTDFTVSSGNVTLNVERVEDVVSNLVIGGTGIDATYVDGSGTLTIDIDSTVTTNSGTQTLTNKTLGSGNSLSASLDAGSNKIINLAAPTSPNDAATKAYVDAVSEGLHIHQAAKAYASANVDIATSLEAGDVLDGVTLTAGDRVLLNGQTNQSQNGIYVVQSTGAAVRAIDFDAPSEVASGDFIFVSSGTVFANTGWVQTNVVGTIGTDPISFTQFSGAGTYTAGAGLSLVGTVFSIDTIPASGHASLKSSNGATEVKADTSRGLSVDENGLGINAGTGLTFSSGALSFASGYGIRKYSTDIGDGTATSYTVTHNFSTRDVTVHIYENSSPYAQIEADVEHTNSNAITVKFAVAPSVGEYRVVVIG